MGAILAVDEVDAPGCETLLQGKCTPAIDIFSSLLLSSLELSDTKVYEP